MMIQSKGNVFSFFLLLLATEVMPYDSLVYDSYSGRVLSPDEYIEHIMRNTTYWCTNEIAPCDPNEGRRIDGSCNNLKNPNRGVPHTPGYHVLPLVFEGESDARKSCTGDELPLSRQVRTTLLHEGRQPNQQFTHLVTHYWVFMSGDIVSFHDTFNYVLWKTYCCEEIGKLDPECTVITVPDDDPVHRFTNIRCLNLTRPFTFQSTGCTGSNNPPERIVSSTSLFDLSQIYGQTLENLFTKVRLLHGGLLKYEIVDGRIWLPTYDYESAQQVCLMNQLPLETRCHDVGEVGSNAILGSNLFSIWMWRHHNHISTQLATINPCWDDDMLFYTAREINIAVAMQIFLYELHPVLLGKENLIKEGVLSPTPGYRDVYNEDIIPQVSLEYGFALRWTHTIQEGIVKMYDVHGNYLKNMRIANLTLRTGYLAIDDNIDYITQGAFRQPGAKIDTVVDPDVGNLREFLYNTQIAEIGLGTLQLVADITSSDLSKNRYFGIAPYVQYRQFCFGEIINTFEDLTQAIDPERIELLKELYQNVKDIDLIAGMWIERPISNGLAPATFYCLMVEQLQRTIVSDRHWYERRNRPNAFTIEQLLEIRKASVARLLCDVGDKVTEIQPKAFLIPGPGNEICSCDEIPKLDIRAWKDGRCHGHEAI